MTTLNFELAGHGPVTFDIDQLIIAGWTGRDAAMVEHHGRIYRDFEDPVALLRGLSARTALSQYWPYAGNEQASALESDHRPKMTI